MNHYVQPKNGGRLYILDPQPEQVSIEEIAQGLAACPRWAGQVIVDPPYTVAEHSVLVTDLVAELGGSLQEQREALVHDATEAFIGDLAHPVKLLCPEYKAIENKLMQVIAKKFGLKYPFSPIVKKADNIAVATEARDLKRAPQDIYHMPEPPAPIWIHPVGFFAARSLFLIRYVELFGG